MWLWWVCPITHTLALSSVQGHSDSPCLPVREIKELTRWCAGKAPNGYDTRSVLPSDIISGGPAHVRRVSPRLLLGHQCPSLIPPLLALSPTSLSPTSAHASRPFTALFFPSKDFGHFKISLYSLGFVIILFSTIRVCLFVNEYLHITNITCNYKYYYFIILLLDLGFCNGNSNLFLFFIFSSFTEA